MPYGRVFVVYLDKKNKDEMNKNKASERAVWATGTTVCMIEQNLLPFEYKVFKSKTYIETVDAIKTMITRGAGSIGATAGFAMAQAASEAPEENYQAFIKNAKKQIEASRPTARDLFAATERVFAKALTSPSMAWKEAQLVSDEIVEAGKLVGEIGNFLLKNKSRILTHCNAGRLALVAYGSAIAPIYEAHNTGKEVFVYVDETRPRSQGSRLTAWELNEVGVPHAVIPDNAAAHYMQLGKIDIVITGADRIAANGDTANKIGTLEKAIAAKHFGIPFYIAAPISTFDFNTTGGDGIPIEERSPDEVLLQTGTDNKGVLRTVRTVSPGSTALNPAFDVTPASLITGFITPKGIFTASELIEKLNTKLI